MQAETDLGRASIHPSVVTLNPGETVKFKVIKMATPLRPAKLAEYVSWSVNEIKGGNNEFGTIDTNGVYLAPKKVPSPHEINLIGEVKGVANGKLFATVIMASEKPFYEMIYEYTEPIESAKYFTNPHSISLDKDGNLLIADYDGNRILRFSKKGKYLDDLGSGVGNEPGQIYLPGVVRIDNEASIFVSDQKPFGHRVQGF